MFFVDFYERSFWGFAKNNIKGWEKRKICHEMSAMNKLNICKGGLEFSMELRNCRGGPMRFAAAASARAKIIST
jgi:hypothetical protein